MTEIHGTDLIQQLKREGQDFEWYPTTREMLKAITEEEMDLTIDEVQEHFGDNYQILSSNVRLIEEYQESTGYSDE